MSGGGHVDSSTASTLGTARMQVTKEPHLSIGARRATVTPIDAVRYAHRHPTVRVFGDPWQQARPCLA